MKIQIQKCRAERTTDGAPGLVFDLLIEPIGMLIRGVRMFLDGELERYGLVLPGSLVHIDGATVTENAIEFASEWDQVTFHAQVMKALEDYTVRCRVTLDALFNPAEVQK